jgi:hypothetical protein
MAAISLYNMKRFVLVVASLLLSLVAPSALAGVEFPKATFAGVIGGDTPDQQGSFSVKTTASGAYTAKVKLGPKTASISGQFDQNFHVDETFTYRPLPFVAIDIHLIMDLDPTGERIIGSVQTEAINNGTAVPFTVYQVFKYTTQNPAPQAGRFTGLFTKLDGTSPEGTGVVSASVSKNGKVRVVGVLPDGSKLSTGGSLSPGGVFPIFNVLYSKHGAFAGFTQFHGNQAGNTTITVGSNTEEQGILWVKTGAGSFTGHERLVLQRYTPPAAGKRPLSSLNASNGAATFTLTGGGLASTFNKAISVSTSNKVSVTDAGGNDENLRISLNPKTGLLTGSLTLDQKRSFNLVVLQDAGAISGFFVGSTGAGDASITPAP